MKNALLVMDVTKSYVLANNFFAVKNSDRILACINKVIKKYRANGDLIIHPVYQKDVSALPKTTMFGYQNVNKIFTANNYSRKDEFVPRLNLKHNDIVLDYNKSDIFCKNNLNAILKANNVQKITFIGFISNKTLKSSASSAHGKGYFLEFIEDATGTPTNNAISTKKILCYTASNLTSNYKILKHANELI